MVSTKTILVAGVSASATACAEVMSTIDTAMPSCCKVPSRLLVLPKTWRIEFRWSPALSKLRNTAVIAPMPVAKHAVPTPSSSSLTLASSKAVVGVPWRE